MKKNLGLLVNYSDAPYIQYKPSIDEWAVNKNPITMKGLVVAVDTLRTGWGYIREGIAPEWHWDAVLGEAGPKPGEEFKRGFSLMVWLREHEWCEWVSNGAGVTRGFSEVWPSVYDGLAKNPGKAACLSYLGSRVQVFGKGTTRIPQFKLVKWIKLPSPPPQYSDEGAVTEDEPNNISSASWEEYSEPYPFSRDRYTYDSTYDYTNNTSSLSSSEPLAENKNQVDDEDVPF